MNLYNIWVSLSEMSGKNIDLFMIFKFFLDVPVYLGWPEGKRHFQLIFILGELYL